MKVIEVVKNLGERFLYPVCIVNCDLPDQPLTFVNSFFCQYTGYDSSAIIGKNCRFLQGPETDKIAVLRIRHAIANRTAICQDLVNYKANGEKFYNRLLLIPFTENNQQFFLGLQHEINADTLLAFHPIEQNEIMDKTMNPIAILAGLLKYPVLNFEENLLLTLNRLGSFVFSL